MLSSSSVELRAAWTTQEARSVEWAGLFLPDLDLDGMRAEIPQAISGAKDIDSAAESLGVDQPTHKPSGAEWEAMKAQARGVVEISSRLESNEEATRHPKSDPRPAAPMIQGLGMRIRAAWERSLGEPAWPSSNLHLPPYLSRPISRP